MSTHITSANWFLTGPKTLFYASLPVVFQSKQSLIETVHHELHVRLRTEFQPLKPSNRKVQVEPVCEISPLHVSRLELELNRTIFFYPSQLTSIILATVAAVGHTAPAICSECRCQSVYCAWWQQYWGVLLRISSTFLSYRWCFCRC